VLTFGGVLEPIAQSHRHRRALMAVLIAGVGFDHGRRILVVLWRKRPNSPDMREDADEGKRMHLIAITVQIAHRATPRASVKRPMSSGSNLEALTLVGGLPGAIGYVSFGTAHAMGRGRSAGQDAGARW
jgi:hypothetical protein